MSICRYPLAAFAAICTARLMDDAVYRDLFTAAPDGIVIVDGDARITMLNAQAEKMFGYGQNALVGRPVEVLVSVVTSLLVPAAVGSNPTGATSKDYAVNPERYPRLPSPSGSAECSSPEFREDGRARSSP